MSLVTFELKIFESDNEKIAALNTKKTTIEAKFLDGSFSGKKIKRLSIKLQ